MRTLLFSLLLLAGPLFAANSDSDNKCDAICPSEAITTRKPSDTSVAKSITKPAKTPTAPAQASARIREGRRPATPKSHRPAHLFM